MAYPSYTLNIKGKEVIFILMNDSHLEDRLVRIGLTHPGKELIYPICVPNKPSCLSFFNSAETFHTPTGTLVELSDEEKNENKGTRLEGVRLYRTKKRVVNQSKKPE